MKRINYILFSLLAFFSLTAGIMYHSGTPGGKTGSPGDGSSCTQCHTGTPITQAGWISSDIPVDGYIPEQIYTVSLIGSHPGAGKYGFEMTSEDVLNSKKGVFAVTNSTNTQLFSDNSITHTAGGNLPVNDGFDYSFSWTAPAQGTGDVTFYAAVNAANGTGDTQGDLIYLTEEMVSEGVITEIGEVPSENSLSLFPNPAIDFVNISLPDGKSAFVNIYNSGGQLVVSRLVNSVENRVSLDDFPGGVYFVKAMTDEMTYNDKFIIR